MGIELYGKALNNGTASISGVVGYLYENGEWIALNKRETDRQGGLAMSEKMDDRTRIYRDDRNTIVSLFFKEQNLIIAIPGYRIDWRHEGDVDTLTLGEIRDQVRKRTTSWTLYVWVQWSTGGEIYCTGNVPGETCWRRCGITGGYE